MVGLAGMVSRNRGGAGEEADSRACLDEASTVEVSQESKPSSDERLIFRVLESMDVGRWGGLLLMSLVLEVIGRTTWEMEERKDAMVSEPARERPLDDGGVLDSIEALPRLARTRPALGLVSFISDGGSGVDSGR